MDCMGFAGFAILLSQDEMFDSILMIILPVTGIQGIQQRSKPVQHAGFSMKCQA